MALMPGEDTVVSFPVIGNSSRLHGTAVIIEATYRCYDQKQRKTRIGLKFKYNKETNKWSSMSGVNVTVGLPIIRTSVDHGTALDLAGTGKAGIGSLLAAIEQAASMSQTAE